MLRAIAFAIAVLILAGCSNTTIGVSTGQGELRNKFRTDRTEIEVRKDIGPFHVTARHESLNSKTIDNDLLSLVDGERTYLGAGVHTDRGTDFTTYVSDELWSIELFHRTQPIRWGLYPILGMRHLDSTKRSSGLKRKTTSAIVGVGYVLSPKTIFEATVTTRNNGQQFIDDYAQAGVKHKF